MRYAYAHVVLLRFSQRLIPPVALLVFGVVGVYAQPGNQMLASFAVTALLSALVCTLLVVAAEKESAGTATELLTVRYGGASAAWRGRITLAIIATSVVAPPCIAWPLVTGAFAERPGLDELAAGVLAHLACGLFGGTLALLRGPHSRPLVGYLTFLGLIGATIPLQHLIGVCAGPGAIAAALSHSGGDPLSPAILGAVGITLGECCVLAVAARWLARFRG